MNDKMRTINKVIGEELSGEGKDNCICFYKNSDIAVVDFSQREYISRIKQLKKEYSVEIDIIHENFDGSVVAKIPTEWIKIQPPPSNIKK